jgi:DNA-binding NtrC family response regulator
MVGRTPAMQAIRETIRKVAPTPSTVLIEGESGTGKELVARAIHQQSGASQARFIAINCAAIPHDLLENQLFGHRKGAFTGADRDQVGVLLHAGSGTVFLDEIGDLSPATQGKILRAIEQKEILPVGANEPIRFEARLLAATNRDLEKEVEASRFREDLYYRLNVVRIKVPPLRERREDIPDLVDFLLAKQVRIIGRRITGVSHETMQILLACPWKGNVRELENALQRAVILGQGPLVTPADLPPDLAPVPDDPALADELAEAVRRFERRHIERILQQIPDKREAARRLGMGLSSLYRKIGELGIHIQ